MVKAHTSGWHLRTHGRALRLGRQTRLRAVLRALLLVSALVASCTLRAQVDPGDAPPLGSGTAVTRINHVQLLGTHNSYKQAMGTIQAALVRWADPALADTLDYAHRSLSEQLQAGVRVFELDVYWDPDGSRFGRAELVVPHAVPSGWPERSAFPVLHVQTIDDSSSCPNLVSCLALMVAWSRSHPNHHLIGISFNAKDELIDRPGFVEPRPFDAAAWDALDNEIRAVLQSRLVLPAEVLKPSAGEAPNWPTLASARGRFLLVLDEGELKRRGYAGDRQDEARSRALFVTAEPGDPGAAVMVVNNPVDEFERIGRLVRAGYLVRTRADADTLEARQGLTARRSAALASGAHWISTDYPWPDARFAHGYWVGLPGGGSARCNPVEPGPCAADDVTE